MVLRSSLLLPGTRCQTRLGVASLRSFRHLDHPFPVHTRFASNPSSPPKSTKQSIAKPAPKSSPQAAKSQAEASRKASLLLGRLSKSSKSSSVHIQKAPKDAAMPPTSATEWSKVRPANEAKGQKPIDPHEVEYAIQKILPVNRRKLLWPGIWTFCAVACTYGTLAFLDVIYDSETASGKSEQPERTTAPEPWWLTPTIVTEGLKAGWNELDGLTIGIVLATAGVQLMKRSPLPFWQHLIHIPGEKKYTAFTYSFVHVHWPHLGLSTFYFCWFLPSVVQYFDGDLFHTTAFLASVPLITSYLQHFAFRWIPIKGVSLNLGSTGAAAAVFGAFCMAYPDEKVWLPYSVIFRPTAELWAALFVFTQIKSIAAVPRGAFRPTHLVRLSLLLLMIC